MNPEFKRQLWLQFSLSRLVLMPALLLIGGLAVVLSSDQDKVLAPLTVAAAIAFGVLALGMGARAARASILDEFVDRTWDQQRMSAMQPWAMTWGKLAGSTAYSWYGCAICLGVIIPCGWQIGPPLWGLKVAVMVVAAIFLQALTLAVNVQLSKLDGKQARRGGWLLVLLLMMTVVPKLSEWGDTTTLRWWKQSWSGLEFLLGSLTAFALCAIVAAWRSMAESLAVRQLPWGWPALGILASVYLTGFGADVDGHVSRITNLMCVVGVATCGAMTYFALVSEPHSRSVWQRIINSAKAGQWHAALRQLPSWITSLGPTLLFGLLAIFIGESREPWLPGSALTWSLLVARDSALALFFAFSPRGRRPLTAFLVTLLVLHGLMPWLAFALKSPWVLAVLYPPINNILSAVIANGMAFLHALLAWALLYWRWRTTRPG